MTTSMEILQKVSCIRYLAQFLNNPEVYTLFDFGSKVNVITPAYMVKLSFVIQNTNVGTQKIDSSTLETYRIVIAGFLI